ncbi:hypothetical protein HPB52_016960 [Rhipicephalus sanguineus]|uniref:Cadherin domain-containing protein n=1 Tax=Rhipicephalus sanguineus TaxID=34632 RepID=A0A9D4Q756_RHISA|nr:hypothetical protein HPB52_016960 [Rhipicephalus sanguineus]
MAMVKVYVRDVNDNRPIFYPREYNVSLRELLVVGRLGRSQPLHELRLAAQDGGGGQQLRVRYSIYSGDPEGYFSIDAHLGSIRVERPLDHEAHPFLLLNVQATAGTQPPAYGHTQDI